MKRFAILSFGLLAASLIALVFFSYLIETHCSFGSGGMGCIAPLVGWGDTLLATILGLIGLSGILTIVVTWQAFRWWWRRSPAHADAVTMSTKE